MRHELHLLAAELLNNDRVEDAWQVLLRCPENDSISNEEEVADVMNDSLFTNNHKVV